MGEEGVESSFFLLLLLLSPPSLFSLFVALSFSRLFCNHNDVRSLNTNGTHIFIYGPNERVSKRQKNLVYSRNY